MEEKGTSWAARAARGEKAGEEGCGALGGAERVPGETEARGRVVPMGRGLLPALTPCPAGGGPGRCSPLGSCSRCLRAAAPRRHLWGFCKPLIVVSTD